MTREAVINGTAAWIEKNVLPELVPTGVMSVGLRTALRLVKSAPAVAEGVMSRYFPALSMLFAAVGDDDTFMAAVDALKDSIEAEPGKVMRIQFSEIGLFNNARHSLCVTSANIDDLAESVKAEQAKAQAGGAA